MQETHYSNHKHEFNKLTNKLKKNYNPLKLIHFTFISSLTLNNGSLWKLIKSKIKKRDIVPSLLNHDNSLAITDNEKATIFRTHMENVQISLSSHLCHYQLDQSYPVKKSQILQNCITIKPHGTISYIIIYKKINWQNYSFSDSHLQHNAKVISYSLYLCANSLP